VGNLCTVKKTNRCTSIYECNFIALRPQICFANNVAIFSVVRKGIQIHFQSVRINAQSFVYRTVRWFDRQSLLQLMAAFGLSSFSLVFLTSQVDFACWTFSSLISSQFRALVRWIKFIKKPTSALGFKNVILLHSDSRHVSGTCDHLQGGDISAIYNEVLLFFYAHRQNKTYLCETKLHV